MSVKGSPSTSGGGSSGQGNPPKKLRGSTGTFLPKCDSNVHSNAATLFPNLISDGKYLSNRRAFGKDLRAWAMNEQGLKGNSWMCNACIEYGREHLSGRNSEDIEDIKQKEIVEKVLEMLSANKMSPQNLLLICRALGKLCHPELQEMSRLPRPDSSSLEGIDYQKAWQKTNATLFKSFAEAAIGKTDGTFTMSTSRHLQKSLENLCLAYHPKFVSASAEAESMVLHALSGSRTVVDMYASSNAAGGHTYLTQMIDSMALEDPKFPVGDIFVTFDNQQIIGREYRVKAGGNQKTSVTTTLCVFVEDIPTNVQQTFKMETFLPVPSSNPEVVWNMFLKKADEWRAINRQYRTKWITSRLMVAKEELCTYPGNLDDENMPDWLNSDNYQFGLDYSEIPEKHSSCTVFDLKSLPVNPNSVASITVVLDKLLALDEASGGCRQWFSVYCDGLPHGIAWKLIQNTYKCNLCNISGSKEDLQGHNCGWMHCRRKYEKILLRPGAGHIEINLVRTVFAEFFEVFIQPIAELLGFKTPRSLEACKSAYDHHKSWQILKIVYVSLFDEIVHIYAQQYLTNCEFSPSQFEEFVGSIKNPNLKLALDFTLNILHPLFCFRQSVRQCNDAVAYASLHAVSPLFFGFNHPKYRDIIARDTFLRLLLPSEGAPLASRLSFRRDNSNIGQGLDFLLEERNRQQKQWVFSAGPPTQDQWNRASASLTKFEKIKQSVLKNLSLEKQQTVSKLKFGQEYLAARLHFRTILRNLDDTLHTFTDDKRSLNPGFANCCFTSSSNMSNFFQAFLAGRKCTLRIVSASNINEMSTEELRKIACKKLRQIPTVLKGNLEAQLAAVQNQADLVEIIGELEYIVSAMDYSVAETSNS